MDRPASHISDRIDLNSAADFHVGAVLVEPSSHMVSWGKIRERVQPLPLKVLVFLAQREGQLSSRDELIAACWNGRIVTDDVINRAILIVRGLAKRSGAFTIETVPKAGYRLVPQEGRSDLPWSGAILLAAIGALAALIFLQPNADQSQPPLALVELRAFDGAGSPLSVEVARETDTALARMLTENGLPVSMPGSVRQPGLPADLRVTGTVRRDDDEVEANLQVEDLRDDLVILTRQIRVPVADAHLLPGQAGAFAATSLATTGAMMVLDRHRPGDPKLTGEHLRQLSLLILHEDPLPNYQGIERIADRMPDSAIAQLSLAMNSVHAIPLMPALERPAALAKARAAAAKARQLAPGFGDTYWTECRLYSAAQFARCEGAMRTAFKIDPDAPFVAAQLRNVLVDVGRRREALTYDKLAVSVMPFMPGRLGQSFALLEGTGTPDVAARFDEAVKWWPRNTMLYGGRLEGLLNRGALGDAAAFVRAMPNGVKGVDRAALLGVLTDTATGQKDRVLKHCSGVDGDMLLGQTCLAALVQLGDLDSVFAMTDRLFPKLTGTTQDEMDRQFLAHPLLFGPGILLTPPMAPVRRDPRFVPLAQRVGLTPYWRTGRWPDFCTAPQPEPVCAKLRAQEKGRGVSAPALVLSRGR